MAWQEVCKQGRDSVKVYIPYVFLHYSCILVCKDGTAFVCVHACSLISKGTVIDLEARLVHTQNCKLTNRLYAWLVLFFS